MKTAIILFGHIRTFSKTKSNFLKLLTKLDADVFIHTWDVYGFSTNGDNTRCFTPGLYSDKCNIEPRWDTDTIDFSLFDGITNIKNCVIETKDEVMPSIYEQSLKYKDHKKYEHDHPGNILSCNRKIYLGTQLATNYSKKSGIKYDMYISIRFDLNFDEQIFLNADLKQLNIYTLYGCAAHISCFGTPEQVTKYANIYKQFDFLINKGTKFNPHELDKDYFEYFKIPYKTFNQMSIVR